MRICFIYIYNYQTILTDSRILKEASALKKAGHDIIIIHSDKVNKIDADVNAFGVTIPCVSAWKKRKPLLWNYLWLMVVGFHMVLRKLGIILHQGALMHVAIGTNLKPDVVHAHDFDALGGGYLIKKLTGAKLIYDNHEIPIRFAPHVTSNIPLKKNKILLALEKFLIKRADNNIMTTDSIANVTSELFKIKKPTVIMNYTPMIDITNASEYDIRSYLSLPNDSKIVYYSGVIDANRYVVKKIFEVAKELPEIDFVLQGAHFDNTKIVSFTANTTLKSPLKNVHFLPWTPPFDFILWASTADIGIIPVPFEWDHRFPVKLGECVMAGLPIVGTNYPVVHYYCVDQDLGDVFDPDDISTVVEAIKKIIDPETYARKKKNVMEARNRFNWENEEKKLLEMYNMIEANREKK